MSDTTPKQLVKKLTALEVRIKALEDAPPPEPPPEPPPAAFRSDVSDAAAPGFDLTAVAGKRAADQLTLAGYGSPDAIMVASDDDLLAVTGVGATVLAKLRAAVNDA